MPRLRKKDSKRSTANSLDSKLNLSVNQKILAEINGLYTNETKGLQTTASNIGLQDIKAPPKKITVMICGNHSSGKSSFVNWYIDEHIQKTGVAIETQKFTLVTSGRKRESLQGATSLHFWGNRLKDITDFRGMPEYLETEVAVSAARKFPMCNFIDTPGLVDGEFQYPCDVDDIILYLADFADLVLVFFDPMGQALCKRTMAVVSRLNENHGAKMRFFLSKADSFEKQEDCQKVLIQITQNLTSVLNNTQFTLPTIYVPKDDVKVPIHNAINDLCLDIERTLTQSVQTALNSLETDCKQIESKIDDIVENELLKKKANSKARNMGIMYFMISMSIGLMMPIMYILGLLESSLKDYPAVHKFTKDFEATIDSIPDEYRLYFYGGLTFLTLFFLLLSYFTWSYKKTIPASKLKILSEQRTFVKQKVMDKRKELYKTFFKQLDANYDG